MVTLVACLVLGLIWLTCWVVLDRRARTVGDEEGSAFRNRRELRLVNGVRINEIRNTANN
jgi:hypothetical protein